MKIEEAIKQKKFESAQHKAWVNIIFTFNVLSDLTNQVFKDFDITQQQYNVLRILRGRHPEPASCASVKDVMLDKNPDLTRLCDRLISKGLIERELNADNRRQVILKITDNGLALLEKIDPEIQKHNKYLNNLTESEAETLSQLLDKFRG